MDKQAKTEEIEPSDEIFYPSFLFKEIFVMMLIFILVAIICRWFSPLDSETRPIPPTICLFPSPSGISCPCMNC